MRRFIIPVIFIPGTPPDSLFGSAGPIAASALSSGQLPSTVSIKTDDLPLRDFLDFVKSSGETIITYTYGVGTAAIKRVVSVMSTPVTEAFVVSIAMIASIVAR